MTMNLYIDPTSLERQLLDRLAQDRLIEPPRKHSSLEIQREATERARAERNHERLPLAS